MAPDYDFQTRTLQGKDYVVAFAYDRLLAIAPGTKLVPYLAKSWTVTPTTVTFKLRTDARCNNGARVTPAVVANSFKRLITGSTAQYFGPGPFSVSYDNKASTFTWRTETPNSDMIWAFAMPQTSIVCPAGLIGKNLATGMYGSGPYILESGGPGSNVVKFVLNKAWKWGPQGVTAKTPGLPREVEVDVVTDETTAANLLGTGGLDLGIVIGADVARLQADKRFRASSFTAYMENILAFNMRPDHPTADKNVRAALSFAMDSQAFTQAAVAGRGKTSPSFFTQGMQCYDPQTSKLYAQYGKYDMTKAAAALQAAGYTQSNGKWVKDGKQLTITVLGSSRFGDGGAYLASQYQKLGINVDLQNPELSAAALAQFQGKFDVSPFGLPGYVPAPSFAIAYASGKTPEQGGTNLPSTGTDNPNYKAAIDAALRNSGKKSCKSWTAVQRLVLRNSFFKPLYATTSSIFSQSNVDYLPFSQFWEPYLLRKAG